MVYPPHRTRFDGLNHARFLTCSCFRRRAFLSRDRTCQWLVEAIGKAREAHGFDLWAWVIMPEHFHLLIFPRPDGAPMSQILSTIKQSVAKRATSWVKQHAPEALELMADHRPDGTVVYRFWQRGGGYDRNLWTPEHIWAKIEYIHDNPVKRGLCARAEDWLWSSARTYVDRSTGLLAIDDGSIPTLRQR